MVFASSQEIPNTARDCRLDVTFLLGKVGHSPELGAPWGGDTTGWGHGWARRWPREGMGTRTPVFPSQLRYLQAKRLLTSPEDEIIAGEMLGAEGGRAWRGAQGTATSLCAPSHPQPQLQEPIAGSDPARKSTSGPQTRRCSLPQAHLHPTSTLGELPRSHPRRSDAFCLRKPADILGSSPLPARGNATATGAGGY